MLFKWGFGRWFQSLSSPGWIKVLTLCFWYKQACKQNYGQQKQCNSQRFIMSAKEPRCSRAPCPGLSCQTSWSTLLGPGWGQLEAHLPALEAWDPLIALYLDQNCPSWSTQHKANHSWPLGLSKKEEESTSKSLHRLPPPENHSYRESRSGKTWFRFSRAVCPLELECKL